MVKKLVGKTFDLDPLKVHRFLPNRDQRFIGPYIFFDHMGPADFEAGNGVDVRPHPHIGLSTLTYLMEGSLLHRDNLGSYQEIIPGDINWMTAGTGIVHSERETDAVRNSQHRLNGLQLWIALPSDKQEIAPAFHHYPKAALPTFSLDAVSIKLGTGEAFGHKSPITNYAPFFFMDMHFQQSTDIPFPGGGAEYGIFVLEGQVSLAGEQAENEILYYIGPDEKGSFTASAGTRLIMLGGKPLQHHRHIWWNFVSTDKQKIDEAKEKWAARDYIPVPGDDDYTPMP